MGLNLDYSKQSFESLVAQMDTPIKVQFVVWLDERLAEYKVQGFMNFSNLNTQLVPRWLKTYNKYANKSSPGSFRARVSPAVSHPATLTSDQSTHTTPKKSRTHVRKSDGLDPTVSDNDGITINTHDIQGATEDRLLQDTDETNSTEQPFENVENKLNNTKLASDSDVEPGTKVIVKTESTEDDDDVMVLSVSEDFVPPSDYVSQSAISSSYSYPDRTTYPPNYTTHTRPMKSTRPANRFTPKNSYAAAVARKRKLSRPQHRPAETIVHPPQQHVQLSSELSESNRENMSESIYAAGNYDDGSGFVETDPSVLASQGVYATEDEYIQFPTGSDPTGQGQQTTVKTEYYGGEGGDPSMSFNEQSDAEMLGEVEQQLDSSYEGSFNEGAGEAGTSGLQESWFYQLTESGPGLWKCVVCDKLVSDMRNLQRHVRTHTGRKDFTCTICEYMSSRSDNAKAHLATHKDVDLSNWRGYLLRNGRPYVPKKGEGSMYQ